MADDKIINIGIDPTDIRSIQQLVEKFQAMAREGKITAGQLMTLESAIKRLVGVAARAKVSSPFTTLVKDTKFAEENIQKAQEAFVKFNSQLSKAVGTGFSKTVAEAKSLGVATAAVNAEVEKQARLRQQLATLGIGDKEAIAAAKNLETLKKQTAELEKQAAVFDRVTKAREALQVGASVSKYRDQLKKETEEFEKQEAVAKRVAKARERLNAAQAKAPKVAYEAQLKNLAQLEKRLNALSTKAPTKEIQKLKSALLDLNLQLAKTGKVGFSGITTQLTSLESQFKTSSKSASNWSKSMQYALGGAARSIGAFTYSYAQLGPLLAGIAFGAAIKQVYELGAAFEYATVYIDAIDESLGGLSADRIQTELLSFEGLRKGPEELAAGLRELAKAGDEAAVGLGQVEELAKFATLAEIDLTDATKLVVGQSKAFGITYSEAANQISAAALSSATDIQELASALSYTTELATVSGVQFDEVATAMAILANSGIRACYDDQTDVLTKDGWKKWEDVTYEDELATYNSDTNEMEYQKPTRLIRYHHSGRMYKVVNKGINLCVTDNHRMYVKPKGKEDYCVLEAKDIVDKPVRYRTGGLGWSGDDEEFFTFPGFTQNAGRGRTREVQPVKIKASTWAKFLGWYISEGHCRKSSKGYNVIITQKKSDFIEELVEVLDELPWKYDLTKSTGQYRFSSQQLYNMVAHLGNSLNKYIPSYAKNWSTDLLYHLLDALMKGDGDRSGKYYTSSARLKDDVQEIALKLGYTTKSTMRYPKGTKSIGPHGGEITASADCWYVTMTKTNTEPWWEPSNYKGKHGARLIGRKKQYEIFEGWVDYDGEAFCAEVPNGLLIVRRGGRAIVSGNSKAGTAVRTSILKMQAPSATLKKKLDELNISWNAFTEEGQIKDLRTMFSELKRVTDALPDQQRVEILKELFGLRSLKGGANILRSIGTEWDKLNTKIKTSVEGTTFIDEKYNEVADTVQARWERLGVEIERSLLQAFDSDDVKGTIDNLISIVSAPATKDLVTAIVKDLNLIAGSVSKIIDLVSGLPTNISKDGIILSLLYGTVPNLESVSKAIDQIDRATEAISKLKAVSVESLVGVTLPTQVTSGLSILEALEIAYENLTDGTRDYLSEQERVEEAAKKAGVEIKGLEDSIKSQIESIANLQAPSAQQIATELELKVKLAELDSKEVDEFAKSLEFTLNEAVTKYVDKAGRDLVVKPEEKITVNDLISETFDKDLADTSRKLTEALSEYKKAFNFAPDSAETIEAFSTLNYEATKAIGELRKVLEQEAASARTSTERAIAEAFTITPDQLEVINTIQEKLDSVNVDKARLSLNKFELELVKIEDTVQKFIEKEELDIDTVPAQKKIEELKEALREKVEFEALIEVQKQIDTLNFQTMVNGLKDSESAIDRVQGGLEELREKAFQYLEAKGQAFKTNDGVVQFTEKGIEYFEALINNSKLFKKELKKLQKSARELRFEIQDIEFDFSQDLRDVASEGIPTDFDTDVQLGIDMSKADYNTLLAFSRLSDSKQFGIKFKEVQDITKALGLDEGEDLAESIAQAAKEAGYEGIKSKERQLELLKLEYQIQQQIAREAIATSKQQQQQARENINDLIAQANEAGALGDVGRERQIELLKEAYEAAKELDVSPNIQQLQANAERAKAEMIKYSEAANSLRKESQRDYAEALLALRKAEAGAGDPGKISEKKQLLKNINDQILNVKKDQLKETEKEISGVESQRSVFNQYLEELKAGYKNLETAANGYGTKIDEITAKTKEMGQKTSQVLSQAADDYSQPVGTPTTSGDATNIAAVSEAAKQAIVEIDGVWTNVSSRVSQESQSITETVANQAEESLNSVSQQAKSVEQIFSDLDLNIQTADDMLLPDDKFLKSKLELLEKVKQQATQVNQLAKDDPYSSEALKQQSEWSKWIDGFESVLKDARAAQAQVNEETKNNGTVTEETRAMAEKAFDAMADYLGGYGENISDADSKMQSWGDNTTDVVNQMIRAFKELKTTVDSVDFPYSTDFGGGKATGGPVSSGTTYLVGEKGPELFTPTASGTIIPNHEAFGTSSQRRDVVDINISSDSGESVTLQGSRLDVDKIQRVIQNKERYAA